MQVLAISLELVELLIEAVITDTDGDLSLILVKLYRILDQMEEYLQEDGPISAGPAWDKITLNDSDLQLLLLKGVIEGLQEIFEHHIHRLLQRFEVCN